MAMNQSLRSRIQEDHLSCSICFLPFTHPKALPCVHTFCEGCLRDYLSSFETAGTFPCPMCRADIQIPPTGVKGFPDNHIIASLIDTVQKNQSPRAPPRPSQSTLTQATEKYEGQGRVSPQPQPPPQAIPPRPKSVSPTPNKQTTNFTPSQQTQNPDPLPPNFGAMLSEGIGEAYGHLKGAISYGSGFLKMPNVKKAPELSDRPTEPMSPYEFVNDEDLPPAGMYPNISEDVVDRGPCTKGMLLSFGNYGSGISNLLKPFGLAVGQNGELVLSDRGGNRLFVFSNSGELKHRFTTEYIVNGRTVIKDCMVNGIAVTKENTILVAVGKSGQSIMRTYTMEGKFLQSFGEFYRYDISSGITVTPSNHVAITNVAADNVLVFTAQRKFSVKFGSKGGGDLHFKQPRFITSTSKDYLAVSDTGNHCIKLYDISGNFKRSFGTVGSNHGQLCSPLGVAVDTDDNIIIADANNFRVEIFTVKGQFYTTLVQDTNLIGPDVKPVNVAVTPRNNVAVLLVGTGFMEVRVYNWRPAVSCVNGFSNI